MRAKADSNSAMTDKLVQIPIKTVGTFEASDITRQLGDRRNKKNGVDRKIAALTFLASSGRLVSA
jgi:hypothetical protein